jgi:hypothetical protein
MIVGGVFREWEMSRSSLNPRASGHEASP